MRGPRGMYSGGAEALLFQALLHQPASYGIREKLRNWKINTGIRIGKVEPQ